MRREEKAVLRMIEFEKAQAQRTVEAYNKEMAEKEKVR